MNTACSTCLGSFTSVSDISTIPCGHIFHTNCIEKWLESGSNSCSQCRKEFRRIQIIKLYFSEGQSENNLITELEEAKSEAIQESLKYQKQNTELLKEVSVLQGKNSGLQEENIKLNKHLKDIKTDSKTKERILNKRIEELTKEVNQLMSQGGVPKKRKCSEGKINVRQVLELEKNDLFVKKVIEDDDKARFKRFLDKVEIKNPVFSNGMTALHVAAKLGRTEIFKIINAEVEDKNPKETVFGSTPLHQAARNGHKEIVKTILDLVDDKNPKSQNGLAPLH